LKDAAKKSIRYQGPEPQFIYFLSFRIDYS